MKVKIDECLPQKCAEILLLKGYDAETVYREGLRGATDLHLWSVVQREKRFLITTDLDFSDVRRYQPGQHEGILLMRLPRYCD
jgi:predicted nuclease of predicted toxin-antitoxin system